MNTYNSLFCIKEFIEHHIENICNDYNYYDQDTQLPSNGIHDQFKPKVALMLQPFEYKSKICAKNSNTNLLKTNEESQLNIIKEAEEVIESLLEQVDDQKIENYKPIFATIKSLVCNDQTSIKEKNQNHIFTNYLENNNASCLSKDRLSAIQDKKETIELFIANDGGKNERENSKGLFCSDYTVKEDIKKVTKEEEKEAKQENKLNQLNNQSQLNDMKLMNEEEIHKVNHKNNAEYSKFISNDKNKFKEIFINEQIDRSTQADELTFCKDYRLSQQIAPNLDCVQIIIPSNGTQHLMVAKFCKKNIKVGLSKFQKVKRLHKKFKLRQEKKDSLDLRKSN